MKKMFFSATDDYGVGGRFAYGFAGVGCEYEQEHVRRPGGRSETEWIYPYYQWIGTRKGAGVLLCGGRKYTVGEGRGMLLFPNEPHEYYALTDSWEVDWVVFEGSGIEGFIRGAIGVDCSGVYTVASPSVISELIVRLYGKAVSDDPLKYAACSGIVYEILLQLYMNAFGGQGGSVASKAERLLPVFRYIDAHLTSPIQLFELAELISVTPQYLCVLFKGLTGRTVSEYINSVRIGKSKELLLSDRGMKIREVAEACGFSDVSYFCASFKKSEKLSPGAFRERG